MTDDQLSHISNKKNSLFFLETKTEITCHSGLRAVGIANWVSNDS